jgi:hypothetical protein
MLNSSLTSIGEAACVIWIIALCIRGYKVIFFYQWLDGLPFLIRVNLVSQSSLLTGLSAAAEIWLQRGKFYKQYLGNSNFVLQDFPEPIGEDCMTVAWHTSTDSLAGSCCFKKYITLNKLGTFTNKSIIMYTNLWITWLKFGTYSYNWNFMRVLANRLLVSHHHICPNKWETV